MSASFKEEEIARRKLALPSFAQDQVPQEHPEVIALFKDFEAATPTERVQRWNRIKQELRDYYYAYHVPPTLQRFVLYSSQGSNEEQETAQRAPPLYRVWLEFRLEDLYDRRPETMPLADDPCWDAD